MSKRGFESELFHTVARTQHASVTQSEIVLFLFQHMKEAYQLYRDISDEESRWVAFRMRYGGGMLPGEAICKLMLAELKRKHKGVARLLFW